MASSATLPRRGIASLCRSSHQSRRVRAYTTAATHVIDTLKTPTWSARSLLPPDNSKASVDRPSAIDEISPSTLHHLLRLSALPAPSSSAQESKMLATLGAQLHFVAAVRAVDTAGVPPLARIDDQTKRGARENEITLEHLDQSLLDEGPRGAFGRRRLRRTVDGEQRGETRSTATEAEDWRPLALPKRKVGHYFVVESGTRTDT